MNTINICIPTSKREYQEAIDQLYELHQKYNETHKIIIGGDINENLNEPTNTQRNLYR
jgi:hypothetical protein